MFSCHIILILPKGNFSGTGIYPTIRTAQASGYRLVAGWKTPHQWRWLTGSWEVIKSFINAGFFIAMFDFQRVKKRLNIHYYH